jgi:hypothetical protein
MIINETVWNCLVSESNHPKRTYQNYPLNVVLYHIIYHIEIFIIGCNGAYIIDLVTQEYKFEMHKYI